MEVIQVNALKATEIAPHIQTVVGMALLALDITQDVLMIAGQGLVQELLILVALELTIPALDLITQVHAQAHTEQLAQERFCAVLTAHLLHVPLKQGVHGHLFLTLHCPMEKPAPIETTGFTTMRQVGQTQSFTHTQGRQ